MSASNSRRRDEHPARECPCPVHTARRLYQREWARTHARRREGETTAERREREARELAVARGELPAQRWSA
jgi:hypothetical protein